jgi:uncharacterized protein (TIGR02246 family)
MTEIITAETLTAATVDQIAAANFAKWNALLQTRDAAQVAALYSEDATFLPTLSGEFKKGRAGAEEYFHHFLEKHPSGVIVNGAAQIMSPTSYLHSGLYNFTVGPDDNRQVVEARFTYAWSQDEQGNWLIRHHHSSVKPQ